MLSEVTALLQSLIGIKTVNPPGNETELAIFLQDWLRERGIDAELQEVAPGRHNLIARLSTGAAGPCVAFNTHMDIVPPGDGWDSDPWHGVVVDDRIVGRGAADAKGSLAAMAVSLVMLRERQSLMRGDVVLTAVVDEEVGSAGARALLRDFSADAAIIGEPTDLQLLTAHKGSLRPVIEVLGRAAHAAQPEQGANAIEGAANLLVMLQLYGQELQQTTHRLVGAPTVVPVLISGGEAPNMVPERCRIVLDRRLIPGETAAGVLTQVRAVLERFNASHPQLHATIAELAPSTGGPSETPADASVVRACIHGLESIGLGAQPGGLNVNCDMTHFRSAGIPTVIFGPGNPAVMHQANESVSIADLERAVEGYSAMVTEVLDGRLG